MTESIPSALHMQVGRIDGRLEALESRMTRHETEVRSQLNGMDTKLDTIQKTLAERGGIARGGFGVVSAIGGALTLAAAWISGWVRFGAHP